MNLPYEVICSTDDRAAWLQHRIQGIGASESPVLLGLSTFSSMMEIWGQKRGLIPLDSQEETERMHWGLRLEPLVAEEYQRQTGRRLTRWAELLRSTAYPYLLATPDYRWEREDGAIIPVEIKCTDFSRKSDWADGPPPRVYYQCQHQVIVTGAPMASIGLLVGGNQFYWADVARDEAAIAAILETCESFWEMITSGILPIVDGTERTSQALKLIFPHATPGETLTLPQHACEWTSDLETAKAEAKALADKIRILEDALKAEIGNAEMGVLPDGSGAWKWQNVKRKGYEVKATEYRQLVRIK